MPYTAVINLEKTEDEILHYLKLKTIKYPQTIDYQGL